jgi:hypothetical protein
MAPAGAPTLLNISYRLDRTSSSRLLKVDVNFPPLLLSCLSRVSDVSLRVYRADDRQVR